MAKRKAARATKRRRTGTRTVAASRTRSRAKKSTRKRTARKPAATQTRATARKGAQKTAASKGRRKAAARKATRKTVTRKTVARKAVAQKAAARKTLSRKTTPTRKVTRPKAVARKPAARRIARPATPVAARKVPALDRERRTVQDDFIASPPSSLNVDLSASAARTGAQELRERYDRYTETGPAITGGDIDADWESAYSVGDEAPGGDSPTPDQDIVDDIGRAMGVQYEDNEELEGEKKISDRDKKRWELDPASSEDFDDR